MKNETLTAILNEKDKLSAYMGVGVDYYKGETGKSGADEVYIGPEPPTDPQVKLWVDTEAQSVGAVDWDDVGNKPNFATVAESGSYNDLTDKPVIPEAPDLTPYAKTADLSTVATTGSYEDLTNKPTIPDAYTLPTASTSTLGGVKVDGSTITIADGVISSAGGGLIGKKIKGYRQPESEWTWMADWAQHPEKYYVVVEGISDTNEEGPVIRTYVSNNSFYYYWFEDDTLHRGYINFTDNTLSQVESVNQWPDAGTVWLTEKNRWAYIPDGGSEPDAYLKSASVSGNTLTLTNKDNTTVVFTPSEGSGSINAYKFSSNTALTTEEKNQLIDCVKNREKIILIDDELVFSINTEYSGINKEKINSIYFATIANKDMIRSGADVIYGETNTYNYYTFTNFPGGWQIQKYAPFGNNVLLEVKNIDWPLVKQDIKNGKYNWMIDWAAGKEYLVWVNNYLVYATSKYANYLSLYLMGNDYGDIFNVANINIYFTDTSFTELDSTKTYSSFAGNTLLTSTNWNNYITVGGGSDWQVTTSTSVSNLYNAKEVVIFWQDSNYNRHQSYLNVGCDYFGNSGSTWGSSNWLNTEIRLDSVDSSNNGSSITYDGSNINTSDCMIEAICYKT